MAAAVKDTPTTIAPLLTDGVTLPCFLGFACLSSADQIYDVMGTSLLGDFAHLFASHAGQSGEVYAFDTHGRLLTESRFTNTLRGILLPSDVTTTIFNLQLRYSSQATAGALRSTMPFTLPVRECLAGRDGSELDGYVDYRADTVLAAWKWLPHRQLGMLHLAAEPRNDHRTIPTYATSCRGLLCSPASGIGLDPAPSEFFLSTVTTPS